MSVFRDPATVMKDAIYHSGNFPQKMLEVAELHGDSTLYEYMNRLKSFNQHRFSLELIQKLVQIEGVHIEQLPYADCIYLHNYAHYGDCFQAVKKCLESDGYFIGYSFKDVLKKLPNGDIELCGKIY